MAENGANKKSKFSLIELLMIIMIVGIVFTLVIPLRNDRISQKKLEEAIRNVQIIARANVAFKDNPNYGYYIFEHTVQKVLEDGSLGGEDLLNIQSDLIKYNDVFYFDYAVSDSSVIAITNKNFGKEGAVIHYYLPNGPWIVQDDPVSRNTIDPNWLP